MQKRLPILLLVYRKQTFPVNPSELSLEHLRRWFRENPKTASRNNTERLLNIHSVLRVFLGMKPIVYSTSSTKSKSRSNFSGLKTTKAEEKLTNYNWCVSMTGNLKGWSSTAITTALQGNRSFKALI